MAVKKSDVPMTIITASGSEFADRVDFHRFFEDTICRSLVILGEGYGQLSANNKPVRSARTTT
jgi:hypothetical protein